MVTIACCSITLAGCLAIRERGYVELGLGVKMDSRTSAVLRPECDTATGVTTDAPRSCGGSNPTVHVRMGLELDGWLSYCEWEHFSHLRDGWPFNENRETRKEEVLCAKRWGADRRR
jgi:hypothetical protein